MIIFKQGLKRKEQFEVLNTLDNLIDLYGDFYITKNNLRLFIKENLGIVFKDLSKGDIVIYEEKKGVGFIVGYSDKANRKYLKLLTKDTKIANRLLRVIFWNLNTDLYIKIKKDNPLKKVLLRNGFIFAHGRGKEILLIRSKKEYKSNGRNKNQIESSSSGQ